MKATFWSAGKDGRIAKLSIFAYSLLALLWLISLISIAFGTSYFEVNGKDLGAFSMVCMLLFFSIITSFIPFLSINMVKMSYKALKRNTRFTIEILTNEERNSHKYINTGDIVFGDKHGIVISHNKQAYDDWTLFYGSDSLYDFYDAKEKVGV